VGGRVLRPDRLKGLLHAAGGPQGLLEAVMPTALAEAIEARRVF
jgi:hypothetical protein